MSKNPPRDKRKLSDVLSRIQTTQKGGHVQIHGSREDTGLVEPELQKEHPDANYTTDQLQNKQIHHIPEGHLQTEYELQPEKCIQQANTQEQQAFEHVPQPEEWVNAISETLDDLVKDSEQSNEHENVQSCSGSGNTLQKLDNIVDSSVTTYINLQSLDQSALPVNATTLSCGFVDSSQHKGGSSLHLNEIKSEELYTSKTRDKQIIISDTNLFSVQEESGDTLPLIQENSLLETSNIMISSEINKSRKSLTDSITISVAKEGNTTLPESNDSASTVQLYPTKSSKSVTVMFESGVVTAVHGETDAIHALSGKTFNFVPIGMLQGCGGCKEETVTTIGSENLQQEENILASCQPVDLKTESNIGYDDILINGSLDEKNMLVGLQGLNSLQKNCNSLAKQLKENSRSKNIRTKRLLEIDSEGDHHRYTSNSFSKNIDRKGKNKHENFVQLHDGNNPGENIRALESNDPGVCKTISSSDTCSKSANTNKSESSNACNVCKKIFKKSFLLEIHRKKYKHKVHKFEEEPSSNDIVSDVPVDDFSLGIDQLGMGNNLHKCVTCDQNFRNSVNLKKHLKQCKGDTIIEDGLDILNENYDEAASKCRNSRVGVRKGRRKMKKGHINRIIQKKLMKKEESTYTCDICLQIFTKQKALTDHMRNHTDTKEFKCTVCNSKFKNNGSLKTHKKTHNNEQNFKCEICDKTFSQKGNLTVHYSVHTEEKAYKCDVCGHLYKSSSSLNCHKKKVHAPAHFIMDRKMICDYCGKVYSSLSSFKTHQALHTGAKPYECEICLKVFAQRGTLKRHHRKHSGEKPYVCKICNTAYSIRSNLRRHERVHREERPFKCDKCNKAYKMSEGLSAHYRKHTGYRPFICKICGKAFMTYCNRKIHAMIHSGEKPFECQHCGKQFSQNGNLQRHLLIHSGQRPYQCSFCDSQFIQLAHLKAHEKTHKNTKMGIS